MRIYERDEARQTLGISPDDFLVCSFGMLAPSKLNHRLLQAWQQSSLAANSSCHLVFVGENCGGEYGESLLRSIKENRMESHVHITGWADMDKFRCYLSAADVGVQLRTLSRGETSASVLDCMNYAKPTIVNANGSMADLDPETVCLLPEEFTDAELVAALELLYRDPSMRKRIGEAARDTIVALHNPEICAAQYHDAIENYYRYAEGNVSALCQAIVQRIGLTDDAQLMQLAESVAQNCPAPYRVKQLLVDVSALMESGESSVTVLLSQLKSWLQQPPAGYRVEPVYMDKDGYYRYGRGFAARFLDYDAALPDDPIDCWSEDILVRPIDHEPILTEQKNVLENMRRHGVIFHTLSEIDEHNILRNLPL